MLYYRHNLLGWLLVIVGSIGILAITGILVRLKWLRLSPRVPILMAWIIVAQVGLLFGIRAYDNWKLRQELVTIVPAEVAKIVLSHDRISKETTDPVEILVLLNMMRSVAGVSAHHSHPIDLCDVAFDFRHNSYRYNLSRDSKRPDEFWVFLLDRRGVNDSLEIGRITSSRLGQYLEDRLNTDRPSDVPASGNR